jgi:hypothetical protein
MDIIENPNNFKTRIVKQGEEGAQFGMMHLIMKA